MDAIEIESKTPLYLQMKKILKKRFLSGRKAIAKLPTETELAFEYNVNRAVIQGAMKQLCEEGYLYRRPKLGTFISQKKKDTLRIAYYEPSPAHYLMKKIFSLFEKSHPNISIEGTEFPASEEYPGNIAELISDNKVDVIKVSESLFRNFDAPNQFHSLNGYAKQCKDNTYLKPWNAFKSANTHYGFPIAFSPVVMAYNKNIFDKAGTSYPKDGWNWNDFLDKAKKLTGSDRYGFLFSSTLNRWPAFIFQNEGKLLRDDGKSFDLSSAESQEAISFIQNLMHKWKAAPVFGDPSEKTSSLFSRDKIAMMMASYYEFSILNKIKDFSWDIAPLPEKKCKATLLLVDGFVISRKTTNFNLASEFLKFIQSETVQEYIRSFKTLVPVNKNIAEKDDRKTPKNYKIYKQVLPYAELLNLAHHGTQIEILEEETNLLWHGLQSYEEMCEHIKNRQNTK
ncbi:MAG: extracellular solute-binding protein [bacterium]|nr:extracellular solute-binding protein [bacterium]